MKQIWIIAKREMNTFFDGLMAYILIVLFLGFSGFFTWLTTNSIFYTNNADLGIFFGIAYWSLFFFIPLLTMATLAEENRSGTIELLLTKPVNDWQVVLGKFISTMLLIIIALVFTLPYYFTVWKLGPIDHGAVLSGYFGLIMLSAVYASIGIFASSISNNQIVGALLALLIGIMFHLIFDIMSSISSGWISEIFSYLSASRHFDSVARGVIDTKDIIYFLSLILLALVSTEAVMAKKRT